MPDLADLYPGYASEWINTKSGRIFARVGGKGPPLLLLHGFSETHVMWHRVAPQLAAYDEHTPEHREDRHAQCRAAPGLHARAAGHDRAEPHPVSARHPVADARRIVVWIRRPSCTTRRPHGRRHGPARIAPWLCLFATI